MLIIYGFVTWLRIRQVKNHREELIIQFDKSSKFLKYIQREIYVFSHLSSCSCMYAPKMAWVEIQSNSFEGGKNEKWTKMSIFGVTFLWSVFYTRVRHKIFSTLNDGQFLTEKKYMAKNKRTEKNIGVHIYIWFIFLPVFSRSYKFPSKIDPRQGCFEFRNYFYFLHSGILYTILHILLMFCIFNLFKLFRVSHF